MYISLDKDVLTASESVVNWDSGQLTLCEVLAVIESFLDAAGGLAGMDVVGDWSPVQLKGLLRHVLHWTEHPHLRIDPDEATRRNETLNLMLLDRLSACRIAAARGTARPFERPRYDRVSLDENQPARNQ